MVHPVCNDNSKLAGNPGKEDIRFCSQMVSCVPPGNAHINLKVVNGPFDNRAYLIEAVPFFRIPCNATGKIPDKHFTRLLAEYDEEQTRLEMS